MPSIQFPQGDPWLFAKAPFAYNEDGSPKLNAKGEAQLYSYMVPPGVLVEPGDTILVEGPQGQPKFLQVYEMARYERQKFKCKPIANVIRQGDWAANEQLRKDKNECIQGGVEYPGPEPVKYSHHEDFPNWVVAVEEMWVEGK